MNQGSVSEMEKSVRSEPRRMFIAKRWPAPVNDQGLVMSKLDCSRLTKPTTLSIELKPMPAEIEPVRPSPTRMSTSR